MKDGSTETDVLIVGAGPVGLFLANECARRALRWRLVEARARQSEHSKALAVMPRTMELFEMAGIAKPFLEVANRVTSAAVISHGRRLAHLPFQPRESPFPFISMVPQDVTEKLLVEELRRKGGMVEYETTFVSAVQNDDGVKATLEERGKRFELKAAYLVGCDGAHSAVRHLLNLAFTGAAYDDTFMLADIETNDALPANEIQLCPSRFGPLAIFPMSATRRRVVAAVKNPGSEPPSLELVKKLLQERGPRELEARAVKWSSFFKIHHRQVERLGVGRIFVAGDAAHIHSPIGGQGMNTGLHDAWNLVWKIDLVLRKHCDARLLDNYTTERRPVIKKVLSTTDFMTKAMGTPNKLAQTLRDFIIPIASRLPAFKRAFVRRLSQLGVNYRGSPIIEGAGRRYFEKSMGGGKGICSRFLVLMGDDVKTAAGVAVENLCESFRDIVEPRSSRKSGITLVRPDGYIAYETPGTNGARTLSSLRSILERQRAN